MKRRADKSLAQNTSTELEVKFLVPAAAREGLAAEMARGSASLERISLAALYLDTPDRRLARRGISWRVRREGRRWIQTVKTSGPSLLERLEHEVIRPDAGYDASQHAGTPAGDRLIDLLRQANAEGVDIDVRFRTQIRRTARRVRTRGAVVEVAFDEGRLLSGGSTRRIREIEFELASGSAVAMLTLAERWRKRFALIYDPRSKSERGDRLADGSPFPPLRKADRPRYTRSATATEAFARVLDECLAQITRNAIGLAEGDPALRVEHVHQLRVGIRRLRSALRSFRGCGVPSPPAGLVDAVRTLFVTLGHARDSDVMNSGVATELAKVGAPVLSMPFEGTSVDPGAAIRDGSTQRGFLEWITWRVGLLQAPAPAEPELAEAVPSEASQQAAEPVAAGALEDSPTSVADQSPPPPDDAPAFHRHVERRLRRWHRRIVDDWRAFDELDETRLHELRKHIKRQRYAVEFFGPVLRKRSMWRYLEAIADIQDRMGELNDLIVARTRYQALVSTEPAAWFALGWLAARIAEARALAKPLLGRLAKLQAPAA